MRKERKKAFMLSQEDVERLDDALQQKEIFKTNVDVSKDLFDIGDSIDEEILFEDLEDVTLTGLSVLFELLAIFIEKHPEWFKNEESQRVFLSKIDMASKLVGKFMISISDKGREVFNWKNLISGSVPELYKPLIVKRVSFASAIAGLIAVAIQAEPFANALNFMLALAMYAILFLYIVLAVANDGEILIITFRKALAGIRLRLYDFVAVKTFFVIRNCESKVLRNQSRRK